MSINSFKFLFILLVFTTETAHGQALWNKASSVGFIAHSSHTSVTFKDEIFVFGGAYRPPMQVFHTSSELWDIVTTHGDSVLVTTDPFATVIGDKIFVEQNGNQIKIFDPVIYSWSTPQTTGNPKSYNPGIVAAFAGGKIYVFELYNTSDSNALEIFDPSTNVWSTPPTNGHHASRYGATAAVVNNKIYLIGGSNDSIVEIGNDSAVGKLEMFDPLTNTFSSPVITGVFTKRRWLTSSVVNGKIYAIGGSSLQSVGALHTVEIFDPDANSWIPGPDLLFFGAHHLSSSVVGDTIYAIGGFASNNPGNWNQYLVVGKNGVQEWHTIATSEIFPNPTTGIVTVQNSPTKLANVAVLNLLGETVIEVPNPHSSSLTLDLTHLPRSTYFVRLESANGVVMKKVVKE